MLNWQDKTLIKTWQDCNNKKRKGINWCNATWNPISGCKNGCSYCYARKISERYGKSFEPVFKENYLKDIDKLNKSEEHYKIFVCSMSDFFGIGVKEEWRDKIFSKIFENSNDYMFLTKQYYNMVEYVKRWSLIENMIFGITLTGEDDKLLYTDFILNEKWELIERRFISFEPLLSDVKKLLYYIDGCEFVIIGSQTNPVKPIKKEWYEIIKDYCDKKKVDIIYKHNFVLED